MTTEEVLVDTVGGVRVHTRIRSWTPLSATVAPVLHKARIRGVQSVHVGQGDCIAVTAENDTGERFPVVYLDFGGGCGKCAKTHPDHPGFRTITSRFEFAGRPKVLLTHWDKDHYFSATKASEATRLEWLVPRQKVGPQCVRFVNRVKSMYCFPVTAPPLRFGLTKNVELLVERVEAGNKGQGDKNLSGLAYTLILTDDEGRDEQRIVMTGDAPYQFVESLASRPSTEAPPSPITCLFAFHHGSRTHLPKATDPISIPLHPLKHRVIFTYGLDRYDNNNFNHPAPEAVRYYRSQGWTQRRNTSSVMPDTTDHATRGHDHRTADNRLGFFV